MSNLEAAGLGEDGTLTAFHAFLEQRRDFLIEALVNDFLAASETFKTFPQEQLVQRVSSTLDVYLMTLYPQPEHTTHFQQQAARMLTDALDSGLTLDETLRTTACLRQRVSQVSLDGIEHGVPGARVGLLRLLDAVDRAMMMISQVVLARVETINAELRRYKSIVEHAPDGIVFTNPHGRLLYVNPAYKELMGYGERTLDIPGSAFVEPSTMEEIKTTVVPQLRQKGVWHGVLFMRSADGTTFPTRTTIIHLVDEHGMVEGTISVVRDIRERHAREERLRLFEALVERATEGVVVADSDGSIQYTNRAYLDLFHLEDGETPLGYNMLHLLPSEEFDRFNEKIIPVLESQGHWQGRLWRFRSDGRLWFGHHTFFELRNEQNVLDYRVAILHDITTEYEAEIERQRLYEELQERAAELRTFYEIAEATSDGVVVMSADGILTYANPSMRRMTGYEDDLVGSHCRVYHTDEAREQLGSIQRQIAERGLWQGRLTYRRRDGSRFPVQAIAFAVTDSNGQAQHLAGFAQDLTEQVSAEQERIRLQESLIEAQQAMLRELSTPLMPLAEGVIAMPLIGSVDSRRAQEIMETLLEGVAQHQAHIVLLDITGVHVVDTQVANALVQAAQAAKLLGAQVILTGIRPDVAHTLVLLGADLSGMLTQGTFESGVAYALKQE